MIELHETLFTDDSIQVPIRLGPDGRLPVYASKHAAGCDLFATLDLAIRPGETVVLPLDLIIALPAGTEAQIRPRSGLSLKTDLRLPNSPGTIDADYRNEVGVILQNTFNPATLPGRIAQNPALLSEILTTHRAIRLRDRITDPAQLANDALQPLLDTTLFLDPQDNPYGTLYIQKGDRIAQMVIARHEHAKFIEHTAPETIGHNRGGGFGSTG